MISIADERTHPHRANEHGSLDLLSRCAGRRLDWRPPLAGVRDGAGGLVGVRAMGELAARLVRVELVELAADLAGREAPELEPAEAGGVDHAASARYMVRKDPGNWILQVNDY